MAFVSTVSIPLTATSPAALARRAGVRTVLTAATSGRQVSAAAAAKIALLSEIEHTQTGRVVIDDQARQQQINQCIENVENLNPNPDPLTSPLLSACWRLVYTDSTSILRTSSPPFVQPLPDQILQYIDAEAGTALNKEIIPFFGLNIKNQVSATIETEPPCRVNVRFREFKVGPIPLKAPETATGFIDITYLDEDMRISRGSKDSVFVLVRQ